MVLQIPVIYPTFKKIVLDSNLRVYYYKNSTSYFATCTNGSFLFNTNITSEDDIKDFDRFFAAISENSKISEADAIALCAGNEAGKVSSSVAYGKHGYPIDSSYPSSGAVSMYVHDEDVVGLLQDAVKELKKMNFYFSAMTNIDLKGESFE